MDGRPGFPEMKEVKVSYVYGSAGGRMYVGLLARVFKMPLGVVTAAVGKRSPEPSTKAKDTFGSPEDHVAGCCQLGFVTEFKPDGYLGLS